MPAVPRAFHKRMVGRAHLQQVQGDQRVAPGDTLGCLWWMVVSAGYAEIGDTPLPEGTRLLDKPARQSTDGMPVATP